MEPNIFCQICFDLIEKSSFSIHFDCSHVICLKCYPYIAFNLLSKYDFSLNSRLLESFEERNNCPLCQKGKALGDSRENYNNFLKNKANIKNAERLKTPLCSLCNEKKANKHCEICQKIEEGILCDECAEKIHPFERKKNHELIPIEQYLSKQIEFGCSCKRKKEVEFYCEKCSNFICHDCCEKKHKQHKLKNIKEIQPKIEKVPQKILENTTNSLVDSFRNQKNVLLSKITTMITDEEKIFINKIEQSIERLIKLLELIKNQRNDRMSFDILKIKKQLNVIETSLELFAQYASRTANNFSEKYQFLKIFSYENNPLNGIDREKIHNPKFKLDLNSIFEIKKRFNENESNKNLIYQEAQEIISNLSFLLENSPLNTSKCCEIESFSSDSLLEMLEKPPVQLEKGSFLPFWLKAGASCAFQINNENYFAWSGYEDKKNNESFPLFVYNLSTRNKEYAIYFDDLLHSSEIQVISTFPKYDDNETASTEKWLYAANIKGVVKCFDITSEFNYEEVSSFQTDLGSEILEVVIFRDKFKEIDGISSEIYSIVTFKNNSIMMYRYSKNNKKKNMEGLWEKFREIEGLGKRCFKINYFYDEIASKTYVFFGFDKIPMMIYQLKENSWDKSKLFPTDKNSDIISINFLFMSNSSNRNQKYVIYTQYGSNFINICDIDNGNIVQKFAIPNTCSNNDLLVWNHSNQPNMQQSKKTTTSSPIYLIVASMENDDKGKGSVNILSLEEDMELIWRKSLHNDTYPANLMKIKVGADENIGGINKKKNLEEKEALVVIYGEGLESSILLYEN